MSLSSLFLEGSGDTGDAGVVCNAKPYAIGFVRDLPASNLPILLGIDGSGISKDYKWSAHPWCLRVFEGDPKALIALDLYIENSDSKSRSASLASGKRVYTAPFPRTPHYKEVIFSSSGFPRGNYLRIFCLGVFCIRSGFHPSSAGLSGLHITQELLIRINPLKAIFQEATTSLEVTMFPSSTNL